MKFSRSLLNLAIVAIPLQQGVWKEVSFPRIKKSAVAFENNSAQLKVEDSHSPLIFFLEKPTELKSLSVTGELMGLPKLKPDAEEGAIKNDDFALKICLAEYRKGSMNFFESWFSPSWVKEVIPKEDFGMKKMRGYLISQTLEVGKEFGLSSK